ncbi:hypothetical protein RQP46_009610 [Phenoliferia psychrophenolica]
MPRATTLSDRNVRGSGSMKKGNVVRGELWFNAKRCFFARTFSRGFRFNEKETIGNLCEYAIRYASNEEMGPLPEGWGFDAQFKRGKSMLDEMWDDELVKDHLLGAETINVKVLDDEGVERVWVGGTGFGPARVPGFWGSTSDRLKPADLAAERAAADMYGGYY